MRTFGALITFLLVSLSASSQPFTESELAWTGGGYASAGLSFYVINKNQILTNVLTGGGKRSIRFAIVGNPVNGAVSSLNSTTGTNVYTPSTDYVGSDSFQYRVSTVGSRKTAIGSVVIDVLTSGSTCFTNCVDTCPSPFSGSCAPIYPNPSILCGTFLFAMNTNLIDTNLNYTVHYYSHLGEIDYTFTHNAGDNSMTWTPAYNAIGINSSIIFCTPLLSVPYFNPNGNQICVAWCGTCGTNARATNFDISVPIDTPTTFALDGSGGVFGYDVLSGPSSGTITAFDTTTGIGTYAPGSGYSGSDQFTYSVGTGLCSTSAIASIFVCNDSGYSNAVAITGSGSSYSSVFTSFNVCNPYSTNRTFRFAGTNHWTVGASGASNSEVDSTAQTNGVNAGGIYAHVGQTGSQSGTEATVLDIPIAARSVVSFSFFNVIRTSGAAPTATVKGYYTNSFR